MLTKKYLLKVFDAFSIQRWNDRIRPIDLCEMDKHGYKMVFRPSIFHFKNKIPQPES